MRSETRILLARCVQLAAVVAGLWLILLYPAYRIGKSDAVFGLTVSAILCLIPGWLVFLVASRYRDARTQMPIVAIGGSVFRLVFILLGMMVIQETRADLSFREFVLWLLVFYMATLAAETRLMLKGQAVSKDAPQG